LKAEYSQDSASPDFQILEGRVRLARSAAEEALPLFRNAMNATSTDPADAGFRTHLVARYYVAQALSSMKMDADVVDVVKPIVNHLRKPEFQSLAGILVQAAISSLQLENFEDTKALADVFLEVSGDSARRADATAARCVALAGLREFAASRKDADFLIEHHKNESRTWIAVLRAAEQASQQKAFAEAAAFFRLAAANTTDSEVRQAGLSGIAWSLFYSKDFSNAEKAFGDFAEAVQERPEFAQAIYMQAQCVEDAGELDRAATMYESVFQRLTENQSPASAEAETRPPLLYAFNAGQESARIYGEFRNLQKANACWESLVMQFPLAASLDRVLNEWAYLNAMEEQYTTADKIYRKLLDRFPMSPYAGHARLSLAESELVAGRRDVARAEFEAVLANPDYGKTEHENALYQLCVILETEFNWADARVKTEQFLMSFPESQYAPLIKLINAESFKRNGAGLSDIQAAQQTLTALRADLVSGSIPEAPWTDRVWIVSAEAAFAAKDYAVIDTIADELTTHRPESPFLFQVRAIQGRRWKTQAPPDFEKAREYFEMVLKDPVGRKTETAAQCQFLLADTYFLQGNFTEARVQYYAVQFNHADYRDWHEQALHQVARCDLELKEVEKARKTLERFVQDYPNSPLLDEVKKTLASLPE
ncbi:MAG: tetratricopeptide repeat protein, partial [Planctomycetaceae bacterium]|nr:tetratricopeptide repeat protein [Planctomycetaceae bacterium]